MAEITYEVYVQEGGRWTLETRYTAHEREAAIEDAKSMHSNPRVKAVKVVRETYDEDSNSTVESTVFSTESAKPLVGQKAASGSAADFEVEVRETSFADMEFDTSEGEDEWDVPDAKKKKKKSKGRPPGKNPIATIFLKILVITTFSLGFAMLMTYLFSDSGY